MNNKEFEQFVLDNGKEILRFCRMTCADREAGDELYQDTMLKLLSKMRSLDLGQNVRSYALSVSILLWKTDCMLMAHQVRQRGASSLHSVFLSSAQFAGYRTF